MKTYSWSILWRKNQIARMQNRLHITLHLTRSLKRVFLSVENATSSLVSSIFMLRLGTLQLGQGAEIVENFIFPLTLLEAWIYDKTFLTKGHLNARYWLGMFRFKLKSFDISAYSSNLMSGFFNINRSSFCVLSCILDVFRNWHAPILGKCSELELNASIPYTLLVVYS